MSLDPHSVDTIPRWSWAAPLAACVLLAGKSAGLIPASPLVLIVAAALLGACVFAAVHHAEIIALRVGEPFGSIILAIAVTVIEVALIVSIMLSAKAGADLLARDTVFATVMLVLNGIVGLCLLLGGARHYEQSFDTNASSAALSVIGTLAVLTLVLPNYTLATPGPTYAPSQLLFVSVVSILLYAVFLFVQTIRHRDYFLSEPDATDASAHDQAILPSLKTAQTTAGLLALALAAVVLLAKVLSPALETAVASAGLPKAFVGVVIAAVVLLPEGLAAIAAARLNKLQTSLNLALGSAIATIGLTIPIVGLVALWGRQPLTLGLAPAEMVLLVLTLFIGTITLATGRTTILQGAVHLVIFAVFLFLAAVP
jgi:Ca2+:H+ antiporter